MSIGTSQLAYFKSSIPILTESKEEPKILRLFNINIRVLLYIDDDIKKMMNWF